MAKRSSKKGHEKAEQFVLIVGAGLAVTGIIGLAAKAFSTSPGGGGGVPTGSTFLGVASQSGNDTLVVPFDINGSIQDVAIGVGGGYVLFFDGVHSYTISVPTTLGASTFQFFALNIGGVITQLASPMNVPAGTYTDTGSQIVAWYS